MGVIAYCVTGRWTRIVHAVSDDDEKLMRQLTAAVQAHSCAVQALTCAVKEAAGAVHLVTRCDLNAMEGRVIKAIGERVNPKDLEKLSTKLEAATDPLEKAVAENQPG
jgi:hypothetical protein